MLYKMLVNVGIKAYIDKKTWKIKPINVGKCRHKNIYVIKITKKS